MADSRHTGEWLQCDACNSKYPIVKGIPILTVNPNGYLANFNANLKNYLALQERRHSLLIDAIKQHPQRKKLYERLLDAYDLNNQIFVTLEKTLSPFLQEVTTNQLIQNSTPSNYLVNLDYLKRDWCWDIASEREIRVVSHCAVKILKKHSKRYENMLLLGAGTGRFCIELGAFADNLYAIDYSYTMPYLFSTLINADISFFDIQFRNRFQQTDIVLKKTASLQNVKESSSKKNEAIANRINYCVGDAGFLPYADDSLSTIMSIYFTDTLPISILLKEIRRVLRPGGLFFHYGPLNYHHENVIEMLAADEIAELFLMNGFKIMKSSSKTSVHLASGTDMKNTTYNNWIFAAIKS